LQLDVSDTETVEALKLRIEAAGGPRPGCQRLVLGTAVLTDAAQQLKALGASGNLPLTLIEVRSRFAGLAKGGGLGPVGRAGELFAARSFTVEAWVRVHNLNASYQGDNAIVGSLGFSENAALHCILRGGRPLLGFYCNDTYSGSGIELNTWKHLAFSYDLERREQSIFVDGELAARGTDKEPLQGDREVVIGQWAFGGRYLNGEVASLNVWGRALSTDELQMGMREPVPVQGAPPEGLLRAFVFDGEGASPERVDLVTGERMALPVERVVQVEDPPF